MRATLWWWDCLRVFQRMADNGWHISPADLRFVEFFKGKVGDE